MDENLKILHIDMDAFFAAVEERENPALKGKPVIIGGNSRSGVVTTANYEARKYGVHSAMPIFMAKQMCPKGYYLPTNKKKYKKASDEVFNLLYKITDRVERVSIDEAYMDISEIVGNPIDIALYIKRFIYDKTRLPLSIGVSYNKFLAKLASDWNKPDGLKVIYKSMIPTILLPLDIEKIHGIGPKSKEKLNNIGVYKVRDLYKLSEKFLIDLFGKQGKEIYDRIRGIDRRKVNISRERKSIGTERTLKESTNNLNILLKYLKIFSKDISKSMKIKGIYGSTVTIKIKYDNFKVKTRSKTLSYDTNNYDILYKTSVSLLKTLKLNRPLRLIGVTVSNLTEVGVKQLSILDRLT